MSRPDLIEMTPTEFEHLVRQLFEVIGMQSWVTQASKDDGVKYLCREYLGLDVLISLPKPPPKRR
jgi:hypothetical protein